MLLVSGRCRSSKKISQPEYGAPNRKGGSSTRKISHLSHLIPSQPSDSMGCHTVDASEIWRENHLGCTKPCKQWNKLSTSTGDRRISEPLTVVLPNIYPRNVSFLWESDGFEGASFTPLSIPRTSKWMKFK